MTRVRVQYQVWVPGAEDGRLVELFCGACAGVLFWQQPRSGTPICHTCHPLYPGLLQEQIKLSVLDREEPPPAAVKPKRRSRKKKVT